MREGGDDARQIWLSGEVADETFGEMHGLLPYMVGMWQMLHALHTAVVPALAVAMQGHHHDGGQEN